MLLLGCSTAPDLKNLHWRAGKAEVLPLWLFVIENIILIQMGKLSSVVRVTMWVLAPKEEQNS